MQLNEEQIIQLRQYVSALPSYIPSDIIQEIDSIVSKLEATRCISKEDINRLLQLLYLCNKDSSDKANDWKEEIAKLAESEPTARERDVQPQKFMRNTNMETYQFYTYLRKLKSLMAKAVLIKKGITR